MSDVVLALFLFLVGLMVPCAAVFLVLLFSVSGVMQPTALDIAAVVLALAIHEALRRADIQDIKVELARIHDKVDKLDGFRRSVERAILLANAKKKNEPI